MSSSFNPLERSFARILSRLPLIKRIVKYLYAVLLYLFKRKPYRMRLSKNEKFLQNASDNTFFGYYDKSPVNKDSSLLIYQQVNQATTVSPSSVQQVAVCVKKFPSNEPAFHFFSKAFNWQQGTKLQWISHNKFVFNDFDSVRKKYVSHIVDTELGEIASTLEKPIYDCYSDRFALSLSFERLAVFSPDYGYFAKDIVESDLLPNDLDGIFYIDLKSGSHKLFLSLEEISTFSIEPGVVSASANHTVNHLMISPDGDQFMFIHRWFVRGRRFDRLLLCDIKSSQLKLVSSNGMVSHCFWFNNNQILGYLRGENLKDSYWMIDSNTLDFTKIDNLEKFGDGHPHIYGNWFVSDSYPDKARMQHLFLMDLQTKQTKKLGEFYHGFRYDGETRCDLHPRISSDGRFIFFDSVSSGSRRLYWMELEL